MNFLTPFQGVIYWRLSYHRALPCVVADGPFGAFGLVDYVDVLWWFIVSKLIMLIY
jgi:hypothetical protein